MEKFMNRYGYIVNLVLGAAAVILLAAEWSDMSMLTKLPVMYIIALAVHETEELKFPGGFVELATSMTGVQLKNIGTAKFGLLLFTIYATVVPACISQYVWPVMATMLIGFIEIFAHLAAARVNKKGFYSPGMISAICVQFPVAVYGYYYMFSNDLIRGIYWLWAGLFLLVPLFGLQALIVKTSGYSYKEFINNARHAMFTKSGREEMKRK